MDATSIINTMLNNDLFSQWLGIELLEESTGFCKLKMQVREEMCNGFGIAHGGICYSLADSALAFASNSRGRHALSIETSISHIKPLLPGDTIIATTEEKSVSDKTAIYNVAVENQHGDLVALFKGIVYRKDKDWEYPALTS